jgi:hypothetical protein
MQQLMSPTYVARGGIYKTALDHLPQQHLHADKYKLRPSSVRPSRSPS